MFVRDRMSSPPVTITPDTPFQDGLKLMNDHGFRRLPVVDKKGELVGIVSERDLLYASPSPATSLSVWEITYLLSKVRVREIMTTEVITTTPDTPIEDAAHLMAVNKSGGGTRLDRRAGRRWGCAGAASGGGFRQRGTRVAGRRTVPPGYGRASCESRTPLYGDCYYRAPARRVRGSDCGWSKRQRTSDVNSAFVVLNPMAGNSDVELIQRALEERFVGNGIAYEVYETTGEERIGARRPLPVQGDGEFVGHTPVKVGVVLRALDIIVPPTAEHRSAH